MDQYFARISATLYRSFSNQSWEPVITHSEDDYTYFSVYTKQHSLTMPNQTFRCQANFYIVDREECRAGESNMRVIIATVCVTLCVVMNCVLIAMMCVNCKSKCSSERPCRVHVIDERIELNIE